MVLVVVFLVFVSNTTTVNARGCHTNDLRNTVGKCPNLQLRKEGKERSLMPSLVWPLHWFPCGLFTRSKSGKQIFRRDHVWPESPCSKVAGPRLCIQLHLVFVISFYTLGYLPVGSEGRPTPNPIQRHA